MQPTSRARLLAESAIMAALTVVLALVAFYVPIVGTVLMFFLPAPVALVAVRQGVGAAVASIVVAGIILVLFLGPVQALALVSVFAFMGLAFGYGIRSRWDAGRTIALGGVAVLLTAIVSVAVSKVFFHQDIITLFIQSINSSSAEAVKLHIPGAEKYAATLKSVGESVRQNPFQIVAPGAMGILAVSAVFYSGLRPIFRRIGQEVPRLTSFAAWRLPYVLAWVWFATMLIIFLQNVPSFAWAGTIGTYLYAALAEVFMVIGASVAYFLCRYFRMSVIISAILAILFAFSPVWSTLLLFAGLFETLFGLRGRLLPRLKPDAALRAELSPSAWAGLEASLRPFMGPPPKPTGKPSDDPSPVSGASAPSAGANSGRGRGRGAGRPAGKPADPTRGPGGGKIKGTGQSGRGATAKPGKKAGVGNRSGARRRGRLPGGTSDGDSGGSSSDNRRNRDSTLPRDAHGRRVRGKLKTDRASDKTKDGDGGRRA